jgi:hypothetical protein
VTVPPAAVVAAVAVVVVAIASEEVRRGSRAEQEVDTEAHGRVPDSMTEVLETTEVRAVVDGDTATEMEVEVVETEKAGVETESTCTSESDSMQRRCITKSDIPAYPCAPVLEAEAEEQAS